MRSRMGLSRWCKFNAVGLLGILVQLAALTLLTGVLHVHYLMATALAVETAVLHNFVWHEHWTWRGRKAHGIWARFLAFNASNGALSLVGNLVLMRVLVGWAHLHYSIANLVSIAACGLINFIVSDRLVFNPPEREGPRGQGLGARAEESV